MNKQEKEEEKTGQVFNAGHKHVCVPTVTHVKADCGFISRIIFQWLQRQQKVAVLVLPCCCVLNTKIDSTLPEVNLCISSLRLQSASKRHLTTATCSYL